jgi:hypothetical protein
MLKRPATRSRNLALHVLVVPLLLLMNIASTAQDTGIYSKIYRLPDKIFSGLQHKINRAEERLNKQTEKSGGY